MFEHADEHGGDTVDGGAFLGRQRLQGRVRVESLRREHHGRARGRATQRTHDHAETVIKRHGDAQPVAFGKALGANHEAAVVDDIGVRQGRAFRRAGGARGKLDVDGVVGIEGGGNGVEVDVRLPAAGDNLIEAEHARYRVAAHLDDRLEVRQLRGGQRAGRAIHQLRRQRLQHADIVA